MQYNAMPKRGARLQLPALDTDRAICTEMAVSSRKVGIWIVQTRNANVHSFCTYALGCNTTLCPNAVHVSSSRLFIPIARSAHKWWSVHAKSKSGSYKLETQTCTAFAHTLLNAIQCYAQTQCTFPAPDSSYQSRDLHMNGGQRMHSPNFIRTL